MGSLYEAAPQVVAAELRGLKPESRVYERKSGLFFLSDRSTALRHAEEALADARPPEERDDAKDAQEAASSLAVGVRSR